MTERIFIQESAFVKYGAFRNVFKCVLFTKLVKLYNTTVSDQNYYILDVYVSILKPESNTCSSFPKRSTLIINIFIDHCVHNRNLTVKSRFWYFNGKKL